MSSFVDLYQSPPANPIEAVVDEQDCPSTSASSRQSDMDFQQGYLARTYKITQALLNPFQSETGLPEPNPVDSVLNVLWFEQENDRYNRLPISKFVDLGKIEFYQRLADDIRRDISYTQSTLLFWESSDVIRRQKEKLAAVNKVLSLLVECQTNGGDYRVLEIALVEAEDQLSAFNDVFTLREDPAIRFSKRILNYAIQFHDISAFHKAILERGRMLRFAFIRCLRDIRRCFRILVQTHFKCMSDQSGHDEVPPVLRFPGISSFTQNWSPHESRYYQAA